MRLAKIIISQTIINNKKELLVKTNEALKMSILFNKYKPNLTNYNGVINLNKLLEMVDEVDNDWAFKDDDIDYAVAYSINNLIETILKHNN